MKIKTNHSGFAAIEALLIIIILAIVGFAGWYVWHSKQQTDAALDNAQESAQSTTPPTDSKKPAPQKTAPTTAAPQQSYLAIKEWGIKIPLTGAIESAVYVGGHYDIGGGSSPDDAALGLLSLGSTCGSVTDSASAPLGWYVRFTQGDVSAENTSQVATGSTSLHELMKTAVAIPGSNGGYGAYYIAYAAPTSDCSDGADTTEVNAAVSAFQQALKNVKSDDGN